ncbi:MAG TPA: ABC transporter substrate-binding protein [Burkholderiales bacterium]|jgi:multiple sugar transport system substrate-binding protein|nr:ABC transporter substrate-binding protein [Burkholderiales bacterium]
MKQFTRRRFLQASAAAGAAFGAPILARDSYVQELSFKPEPGAKLRVLRWKRFVQGDEDQWLANTKGFTERTGVPVTLESENWEDLRPKAAVAANVGSGPDIIITTNDDCHQYPDKLADVSELAEYLGKKYGGWYDLARQYGTDGRRWIGIPMGAGASAVVYRDSHVKAAGFDGIPKDTTGFLKLCQSLKAKGTPPGMALGHATGDANIWCHWLLWSHGAKLVDENGRAAINSRETVAMLEYAKKLYQTFIPGTLSWLDPNNNKAFLSGEISLTTNGVSIYYAAKNSTDPKVRAMADDIYHANMPIGPVGRPTEMGLAFIAVLFKHSKFPQAAREYLRFMWEKEQYEAWMEAALGFVTQPLRAYEAAPVWKSDPKRFAYRDSVKYMLPNGWPGKLGTASAAVMADFVVVDMIAAACTGSDSIQDAIKQAEKRAERYYKG